MKTPIQELIEQLYTMYYKALTIETDLSRTGLSNAICLAESMLEKEKEAMCDFAYKCRNLMAGDEFAITHWYDKTFNTKEK